VAPSSGISIFGYRASFPFASSSIEIQILSSEANDELTWSTDLWFIAQALPAGQTSNITIQLLAGSKTIQLQLRSRRNGCYTFSMERAAKPTIQRLAFEQYRQYGGDMTIASAALSYSSSVYSLSPPAAAAYRASFLSAVPSLSVSQSSSPARVDFASGTVLQPVASSSPFLPGWTGPYFMRVARDISQVGLSLTIDPNTTMEQ
jgi:hypothetical protein